MYYQKSWNKFGNKKTDFNGVIYASKFEAAYAAELDLRKYAKEITGWEKQIPLDLKVNGQHITTYKIDFIVKYPDGHREFTETKGMETYEWRIKWRLLEALFDEFREHPDDVMVLVKQKNIRIFKPKSHATRGKRKSSS